MRKNNKLSAKDKIIDAAWKLFMEQGYSNTTINQIIEVSETSRGAFYHNFHGKEELLFSIAYIFDKDYEDWIDSVDPNIHILDQLYRFDAFVLKNLEESPYHPFLPELYGMQVMTTSTRHINNPNRQYYRVVSDFMKEGLHRGEINSELSYQALTEYFIILERGFVYDWCLNQFRYSLYEHGQNIMKIYLDSLRAK